MSSVFPDCLDGNCFDCIECEGCIGFGIRVVTFLSTMATGAKNLSMLGGFKNE